MAWDDDTGTTSTSLAPKLSKPKLASAGAVNSFARKKAGSPGKLGSKASKLEQSLSKLRAKGATT